MAGLVKIADGLYLNDAGETVHMPDAVASTVFGYSEQAPTDQVVSNVPPPQPEAPSPVPEEVNQEVLGAVSQPPPQTQVAPNPITQLFNGPQPIPQRQSVEVGGTFHTEPMPEAPPEADTAALEPHRNYQDFIVNQTLADTGARNQALDAEAAGYDELQGQRQALQQNEAYDRHYAQIKEREQQAREAALYQDAQQQALARWNAVKQVDPNRVYHDRGILGTLKDAAGGFIGGLLAPNRGGRNVYAEFLNEQIQRDIDAQRANIETQMAGAYRADRQLGVLRESQQNSREERWKMELDRRAAYDTMLDQLDQQFASLPYKRGIADAKAANNQSALEVINNMARQRVEDERYQQKVEEDTRRWEAQMRQTRYRDSLEARRIKLAEAEAKAGAGGLLGGRPYVFTPGERRILVLDPEQAKDDVARRGYNERMRTRDDMASALREYAEAARSLGDSNYRGPLYKTKMAEYGSAEAWVDAAHANLIGKTQRGAEGPGATMTPQELDYLLKRYPEPDSILYKGVGKSVGVLEGQLRVLQEQQTHDDDKFDATDAQTGKPYDWGNAWGLPEYTDTSGKTRSTDDVVKELRSADPGASYFGKEDAAGLNQVAEEALGYQHSHGMNASESDLRSLRNAANTTAKKLKEQGYTVEAAEMEDKVRSFDAILFGIKTGKQTLSTMPDVPQVPRGGSGGRRF